MCLGFCGLVRCLVSGEGSWWSMCEGWSGVRGSGGVVWGGGGGGGGWEGEAQTVLKLTSVMKTFQYFSTDH